MKYSGVNDNGIWKILLNGLKSYVNVHMHIYIHITYIDVCLIGWIGGQWKSKWSKILNVGKYRSRVYEYSFYHFYLCLSCVTPICGVCDLLCGPQKEDL